MKKNFILIISFFLLISSFFILIPIGKCEETTEKILYVGGIGNENYSKIQDAIDNASIGDTVFVYNGTYNENIKINKSINIIGENKEITIIEGISDKYNSRTVLYIKEDWINFSGFTIQSIDNFDGGFAHVGIRIFSNHNFIHDNIIRNTSCGIVLQGLFNHIKENNIIDNEGGIHSCLISLSPIPKNNTISSNKIVNNSRFGISIWNSEKDSKNNYTINNNTISFHIRGIDLSSTSNNIIINNNIENNSIGIHGYEEYLNQILNNFYSDNDKDVYLLPKLPDYDALMGMYMVLSFIMPFIYLVGGIILLLLIPIILIIKRKKIK
jgi:hypothetical protein